MSKWALPLLEAQSQEFLHSSFVNRFILFYNLESRIMGKLVVPKGELPCL